MKYSLAASVLAVLMFTSGVSTAVEPDCTVGVGTVVKLSRPLRLVESQSVFAENAMLRVEKDGVRCSLVPSNWTGGNAQKAIDLPLSTQLTVTDSALGYFGYYGVNLHDESGREFFVWCRDSRFDVPIGFDRLSRFFGATQVTRVCGLNTGTRALGSVTGAPQGSDAAK